MTVIEGADVLFKGILQVVNHRKRIEAYLVAIDDPSDTNADGFEHGT